MNTPDTATTPAPGLQQLQAHGLELFDRAELEQPDTYTEALVWHRCSDGRNLPDCDSTVLCQLVDDDVPVFPGYWDGEQWTSIEGMPLGSRVVAWSDPRGVPL